MSDKMYLYIKLFLCAHINFLVSGSHISVISHPDATTTINLKESLILRCTMEGTTSVDIVWSWKEPNTNEPTYYFKISDSKTEITDDFYESRSILLWKEGIDSETKKSARGTLVASAMDGGHTVSCNDAALEIQWKAEGTPSVSVNKSPLVLGEDITTQLTCQLTDKGNPEGQVRWIKNGNLQIESEYSTDMISILVTKEIDGDKWQCYYYNSVGDGDYAFEVMINVRWFPGAASISADTHTPKLDDTLTFTCTGDRGNPPGRVLWYLDTRLVANITSKQYTVTGVNESHNGNWDCMFKNVLNDGARSQSIHIKILCLPGVQIDYITYEFISGNVNFNLKTKNAFAASTLEVSVCSVDDSPSCEIAKSNIEQNSNLEQSVGLPENSDGAVYNVTFTFSNNYRYIVTQHGIALKGTVVQSQVPVILAALFGTLLMLAIVTIITLVYVFHWRNKATGTNVQSENSVHYVNVGSEGNSGDITHIQAIPEYEDVNAAATTNGQSSNIGNATYMDLDQNDIQQTRNRPAEVTVYQSLN